MPRSIFRSRFPTASRWHFSSKELDSRNDDNLNRRSCFYPSYIIDFMKTRYRSSDYFGQQWGEADFASPRSSCLSLWGTGEFKTTIIYITHSCLDKVAV